MNADTDAYANAARVINLGFNNIGLVLSYQIDIPNRHLVFNNFIWLFVANIHIVFLDSQIFIINFSPTMNYCSLKECNTSIIS